MIRYLDNGLILEDDSISTYDALSLELGKLLRNVEGLGAKECVNKEDVRKKGIEILKRDYPEGYKKIENNIKSLSKQFIHEYCFDVMFFQDAADLMIVDIPSMLKQYVSERMKDIYTALFVNYSVDEFLQVVDQIRDKVVNLAMMNWIKHASINKGKKKAAV